MLEQINILEEYDNVQKNKGQLSMFLGNIEDVLNELEQEKTIYTHDVYALCEWEYVLEDMFYNYSDIVFKGQLYQCLGIIHMLRKRSAVEGLKKESYYE